MSSVVDGGALAADDPAEADRGVTGAHREVIATDRPLDTVEAEQRLAPAAPDHHSRGAAVVALGGDEPVEVEAVQGLTQLVRDVVGDVDDVVDGSQPDRAQPPLHPVRRRRHRDVLDDPHGEARAPVRVIDVHLGAQRHAGRAEHPFGDRGARFAHRLPHRRGHLARDAHVTQAVGPVGGHLDLEHGVELEHLVERLAGETALQVMDASGVLADTQLHRRAQHPRRLVLAAEHGTNPERLVPAGQQRARRRVRHEVADDEVGRAGDHAGRLVGAEVDVGEQHSLGRFWNGLEVHHARHHHPRRARAAPAPPRSRCR